jgi:hypothetical protein
MKRQDSLNKLFTWLAIPTAVIILAVLWYIGYTGRPDGGATDGPQSTMQLAYAILILSCLAGAVLSGILGKMPWREKGLSVRRILLKDYMFEKYSTIILFSYLYAEIQGICIGGFFGGFAFWMLTDGMNSRLGLEGALLPLGFAVFLVVSRIAIEGVVLLYRTAQDIGDFTRR